MLSKGNMFLVGLGKKSMLESHTGAKNNNTDIISLNFMLKKLEAGYSVWKLRKVEAQKNANIERSKGGVLIERGGGAYYFDIEICFEEHSYRYQSWTIWLISINLTRKLGSKDK